jgi:hypothetical protein
MNISFLIVSSPSARFSRLSLLPNQLVLEDRAHCFGLGFNWIPVVRVMQPFSLPAFDRLPPVSIAVL